MEKEIREKFSFKTVPVTQKEIEKAGFKVQAYCREINLFYMHESIRERLDPDGEGVIRAETKVKYSIDEIINELNQFPERFSPNVILRPLYEESILPNIAYIGGGGEIAYWLERKAQFAEANVHFPMLIRRNSLMMIEPSTQAQILKMGLTYKDFFKDINSITKNYLLKTTASELQIDEEMQLIKEAFQKLSKKAEKVDPTLSKAIQAEESKQLKIFEQLGSRLMRTEKQHQDTQIKKLERIREKLFPGNGLQERYENFLPYYANYGAEWIKDLIDVSDPFTEKFILVELPPLAQVQAPARE